MSSKRNRDKRDYDQHVRQLEIGGYCYQCPGCGRRFIGKKPLASHMGQMNCSEEDAD